MNLMKKSKKVSVALIISMIFLLLFSQAAFAAGPVKLSASSAEDLAGEEVTITISIEDAEGTTGGQFDLSFDEDVIEPKSASRGNFVPDVSGNSFDYNLELEDGKLRVLWVIAAGADEDEGTVGTIVFKLLEDGETNLTFSDVVIAPADTTIASSHGSGKVTVTDPEVAKQNAIDDVDEAIDDLPDCDDITLDDKADVEAARALVKKAMDDFDAEEDDFADLEKLECAEEMIKKLEAIKAACDAVNALPAVDKLTLDDKADVVAARALVNKAKSDFDAEDDDFACLTALKAAENRINELEGKKPTPPTGGGMPLLFVAGGAAALTGFIGYLKRRK